LLADLIPSSPDAPARMLVFIDSGVAEHWPNLVQQVQDWATDRPDAVMLSAPPTTVPGGENAKNDRAVVDLVTKAIHDGGICRQSYVMAIGGGAMLDAVGFAAAIAHRGVRLVRLPTTTLAQGDAGIGVKNGINAYGKKNFLGTFAVPWAVVNDRRFLETLDDRVWRSGLSEVVKVALLKDAPFFERVESVAPALRRRDDATLDPILRRCAHLHLDHIVAGGDPFELLTARPLDFGHWSAHRLESLTGFKLLHGEAVAIGVALDVVYSAVAGRLDWSEARRVLHCFQTLGFSLYHECMSDVATLCEGLEEFREHLGGRLTITLLEGIGHPIDVHEMSCSLVEESVGYLREIGREHAARAAG
jgi:3-dehydroquinate synthase